MILICQKIYNFYVVFLNYNTFFVSEFINAIDTDKANPYIEDCIAKEEPLIKVSLILKMTYQALYGHVGRIIISKYTFFPFYSN